MSSQVAIVNTVRDSRSTFSHFQGRTCTSWHCVWYLGHRPSCRGAASSSISLARDAFSRGCWWWRLLTGRLNNLHKPSEREMPRGTQRGPVKQKGEGKQEGSWMRKGGDESWWVLSRWVEVQHVHVDRDTDTHAHTEASRALEAHVWSKERGTPWDFTFQRDLQPLSHTMKKENGSAQWNISWVHTWWIRTANSRTLGVQRL